MWRSIRIASLQTGSLMAVGDLVAQTLVEGRRPFSPSTSTSTSKSTPSVDWIRTVRFASIGVFLGGPALRLWYGALNKYIGSTGRIVTLKKVVVDQCLFAPSFVTIFISTQSALEGKTYREIENDLRANYIDIMKTNYCVWPWVQMTNFYFVPLQYQVLLVQSVALFWNTYISWKTNSTPTKDIHD
ncbi:mitochondrial inner membrane protein MPV17 [Arctopsyche grandis]|uniref:mitochondrial inner membrane protein MPV17 n=1 Tax=Arctopsyche grandis TaxID=121162 RepID=UPI00406D9326